MAKKLSGLITAVFLLSNQAHAQFAIGAQISAGASLGAGYNPALYGSGAMLGANNFCAQDYGPAGGSIDDNDEVDAKKKERNKAKGKWETAKKEVENARAAMNRHDSALKKRLNGGVLQDVKQHIEQGANVDQWTSACDPTASANTPGGAAQKPYKAKGSWCTVDASGKSFWAWTEFARDGGEVDAGLCDQTIPQLVSRTSSTEDRIKCQISLKEYGPAYLKYKEAAEKAVRAEEDYIRSKADYEGTRDRVKTEMDDGETESTTCVNCSRRSYGKGPSTGQIIGGGILAALGGYLSYKGVKAGYNYLEKRDERNAQLGWPTNTYHDPYQAIGVGFPMLQAGLYGALGGGVGAGGFGCGGTFGNGAGNAFGYPPYMVGAQPGGGMWNPGAASMLPYPGNPYGNPYGMPGVNGGLPYPYGNGGAGGYGGIPGVPVGLQNPFGLNAMPYPGGAGGFGGVNPLAAQMQAAQLQMQDMMYRQQAVSTLSNTMQQIQAQIYQISAGGSYSGGYNPYGTGAVLPYPSSPYSLPYPGAVNRNGYTYPGVLGSGTLSGTPGYTGPGTPVRSGTTLPVYGR